MRGKKKPSGTKAEIRAYKKRSRFIGIVIMVAILVVVVAFSILIIYSYLKPSEPNEPPPELELKAAIVDHLSLTVPNQTFNQTATNILQEAGFTVDYYPGEEITVEFYKNLPTHGYNLIFLRVHSGLFNGTQPPLCLFTSEHYSETKYVLEQLTDRLTGVAYSEEEAKMGIAYFGVTPKFVQQDMKESFQNTTIIMMGCNGLTELLYPYPVPLPMPEAFVGKGAKVYVGWDLAVSAGHTDQATIQLITYLTQNQTITQAVENTMNEVGPDPISESVLLYYPTEAQNHVILNTRAIVKIASVLRRRPLELLGFVNLAQSEHGPASVGVIAYVRVVVEEKAGVGFPDSE